MRHFPLAIAAPIALLSSILAFTACGSPSETAKDIQMPPVDSGIPQSDASPSSDGASPPDALPDVPFHEQPHTSTTIPTAGGSVLAHPLLVAITYADDPLRSYEETLGTYLVQSPWLGAVGPEYGVGSGTYAQVELVDHAPDTIDDSAIQSLIGSLIVSGMAPAPSGGPVVPVLELAVDDAGIPVRVDAGSDDDGGEGGEAGPATAVLIPAVYMLFLPPSTTETFFGKKLCDWTGGGYHYQAQGSYHGQTFSYAVVTECPNVPPAYLQTIASHEFIEACTDPSATAPAYAVTDPYSVWIALGGEVGDLCSFVEPQWSEGPYTALQRVYSNAAAKRGGDPCVPAVDPYFATDVEPQNFVSVQPGESVSFSVTGWSTSAVASWGLSETRYINQPSAYQPTATLDSNEMNNGGKAKLTIAVPLGAPSGSYAILAVGSARSQTNYQYSLVGVYTP
jgi:hypothetical protein